MSSLHIGFIAHEYPTPLIAGGGLAAYVHRVGLMLKDRGHRVTVITLSTRRVAWSDEGVMVYELPWPELMLTRSNGGRKIRTLLQLTLLRGTYYAAIRMLAARRVAGMVWRIHSHTPFDLLQATNCHSVGFSLRKNTRIPLVTRVSNYQPLLRSADGRQRSFATTLCDWLEVKQTLDSDASYAPSELLAKTYAKLEGRELEVIRPPFDQPDMAVDSSFYENNLMGKAYLLFFGNLSRLKGVDLIAEALPPIFQAYPDLSMVFVGGQSMISGQKAFDFILDKCSGYENRLLYFSPLPKRLLFPVIQHASAVLLPSRVDNYPNACLEAQVLGKVVIATRDSSLDEMVDDGKTGILVENGCSRSLQMGIERFLELSQEERLNMEAAVHNRVQRICREDHLNRLEQFYQRVICNYRSRSQH